MAFQDLTIAFHATARPERYRLLTHSPAEGQSAAAFVSPFGTSRVDTWQFGLDPAETEMIGTLLYRRLFPPTIHRALGATQRYAHRHGLALRLKLVLDDTLNQLPWEYLFDPKLNQFLTLEQRLAIVRHVETSPSPILAFGEDLALVLFAPHAHLRSNSLSSESDSAFSKENVAEVASRLRTHKLSVIELERATKLHPDYQILHIEAKVQREPSGAEQMLVVTQNGRPPHHVSFQALVRWLGANPGIRLVVLDASVGSGATTRVMLSLASALVTRRLVPSVVALQFPIRAALRAGFWRAFYGALARGSGLDLAMTEGRQAISALGGAWEWGAPVLFSALRDDQPRIPTDRFSAAAKIQDPAAPISATEPPAPSRVILSEKSPAART